MAQLIVIPNWERDFENSKSRQVENATFFCVQNHFDGRRMRRLLKLRNPAELYGAFHAICAIASKCPYRGVLLDDQGPLTALDLADKTGFDVKLFARAFDELTNELIGLLEKHDIEQIDGQWTLPVAVSRWAVPRSARRRHAAAGGRTPTPSDTERHKEPPSSPPMKATPNGTGNHTLSDRVAPSTPSDTERQQATRTEQNRTELPPTVPQGGQQLPESLDFGMAKLFLHDLFGREKRAWSSEEDHLLSDHVPISRDDAELMALWFRLPLDHPVFQVTKAKHELTTFLRDFNGELDKMHRYRSMFAPDKNNVAKNGEPRLWRELFHWKYGEDITLPATFADLGPDQRQDYKDSFQTFVNREVPAA